MKQKAYARAGVDLDLGNRVKARLPALLARARRPEMLGQVGGFGGLFALDPRKYRAPVLVSSVDGVGTKLRVAFALDRHDTIGEDLVNHCVNDIAVLGAEPLFFLDYLGTGKLKPRVFNQIIAGFARGCVRNRCALIGGETAQMPGFYDDGEYDVSGTIVGVVERDRIVDGRAIRRGDAVLGVASSGLHTNGYSLARKILFETLRLKPASRVAELGRSVGAELLQVHRSYGLLVQQLLAQFNPAAGERAIRGLAHITGGGFIDNLPRVVPDRYAVAIQNGSWPVLPVFRLLQEGGKVPEAEMFQVFNMGIGLAVMVAANQAEAILAAIRATGHAAWVIGQIVPRRSPRAAQVVITRG